MLAIALPDDELIPEEELARRWNCGVRTLRRYDNQPDGLPFWVVGGKKFRGVKASAEWLNRRKRVPNPRRAA